MQLLHGIYIREFGVPGGEIKGNDLIPSFSLALSTIVNDQLPGIDLTEEEAIEFLKCGNLHAASSIHGWHLMRYQQHGLGWAKKIGQRWNNYHPREFRILMDKPSAKKS
jgi:NOL1/NOP2/fmu family ribosome biogenesis protein